MSAVDFSEDHLVTGYEDTNVGVWSMATGHQVAVGSDHLCRCWFIPLPSCTTWRATWAALPGSRCRWRWPPPPPTTPRWAGHRSPADVWAMFGAGAAVGPGAGAVCHRPLQLRLILPLRRIYWQQNRGRGLWRHRSLLGDRLLPGRQVDIRCYSV